MKKSYTYCIFSIMAILIGIIFAISGLILQSYPLSSKSALLLVSIVLIITGIFAFAVNNRKYHLITYLYESETNSLVHWTYSSRLPKAITEFIHVQKDNSIATAILFLILSLIFCLIFAYSGGTSILYTGYFLFSLCIGLFLISLRFITAYYKYLGEHTVDIIFGSSQVYFLDELFELQRGYHCLQQVSVIYGEEENYLLFAYGLYDADEPPAYTLTIPIPANQLMTALFLKDHYNDLIKSL